MSKRTVFYRANGFEGEKPTNREVIEFFKRKYDIPKENLMPEYRRNGLIFLDDAVKALSKNLHFMVREWYRKGGLLYSSYVGSYTDDGLFLDIGKQDVCAGYCSLVFGIEGNEDGDEIRRKYELYPEGDLRNSCPRGFSFLENFLEGADFEKGLGEGLEGELSKLSNKNLKTVLDKWLDEEATWFNWKKAKYMDYLDWFVVKTYGGAYIRTDGEEVGYIMFDVVNCLEDWWEYKRDEMRCGE